MLCCSFYRTRALNRLFQSQSSPIFDLCNSTLKTFFSAAPRGWRLFWIISSAPLICRRSFSFGVPDCEIPVATVVHQK